MYLKNRDFSFVVNLPLFFNDFKHKKYINSYLVSIGWTVNFYDFVLFLNLFHINLFNILY